MWFQVAKPGCLCVGSAARISRGAQGCKGGIAETALFARLAVDCWTEEERLAFCHWLAHNATAGDVIPGSGGCRKVRWTRPGMGKQGGVRVIYYNLLSSCTIWLLALYSKGAAENIPAHVLRQIAKEIDHAHD